MEVVTLLGDDYKGVEAFNVALAIRTPDPALSGIVD